MKGLDLARAYFDEVGAPMLAKRFPGYVDRIAAGLVGDGSECFGFDDEISRDHDWGPGFCLWLTAADHEAIGNQLRSALAALPKTFRGYAARQESDWGGGRTGVFEIRSFYRQFVGFDHVPKNLSQWRVIPESYLAAVTNGKVFSDELGEFTRFREGLKAFYPEDIRRKKIAARCMSIAQSGQYNHVRLTARKEWVASHINDAKFITDVISVTYLLNKAYKPFYKWMHRGLKSLPVLGETLQALLGELVDQAGREGRSDRMIQRKHHLMSGICNHLIGALRSQGLSRSDSRFLLDHGPAVQSGIKDPEVRQMNVWGE